jgi:hypothetical protein
VGALTNGVADPLMTVLFGNAIDSFGDSTSQDIVRSVRKVSAPVTRATMTDREPSRFSIIVNNQILILETPSTERNS